ncbi:CPBP family intramembrane metalloprotease [Spiractinospora alimapuensis]|uniref:CPBP family intramembrane glutamic endopeptidase n=1 Tax=Spiractinospora alimapuensis TaxID=2820884 RepID=UPI001F45AEB4|nr:CPBP family intramembrane glutamic endopeptidase [Spiractinospora alimapuensis]QVQ53960.1 CPBP family intramembrane metalloprotease [Spiractinospora alimapuensis]
MAQRRVVPRRRVLTAGLLNGVQEAAGIPGVVIQIVQFSPALGVVAVLLLRIRSPTRRAAVNLSVVPSRRGWTNLVAALVIPLVVLAAALACYAALGGTVVAADPSGFGYPIAVILVAQFVGACGEEFGWRCYLQPELEGRFGLLPAAVAVGLLWGVWHVHVLFQEPLAILGFMTMTVSMSVLLAVMLRRSAKGGLLVAGLFHAVVNVGLLFFLPDAIENGVQIMSFAAPASVLAIAAALLHGRAGRRPHV